MTARGLSAFGSVRWLAVPALVLLVLFNLLPSLLQLVFAFTDWNSFRPDVNVTWFQNFELLLEDGSLWRGVRVSLTFAVLVGVIQNVAGLLLALALERTTRINSVFRTIFFLPVLISAIAIGYTFRGLLDGEGALNGILGVLTGTTVDTEWLGDKGLAMVIVALIHSWKWMGLTMLIYIAGLNAIPEDYKEAARVEGASPLQVFRRIVMPLLAPAITVNVVLTTIGALTTFDIIFATTKGGPARSTEVLNMFIFSQYGAGYFGYATALSLVLFLIVCAISLPLLALLRRREVTL